MPSLTYGLIVEGPYDAAVYEELLRKAVPAIAQLVSRPVGGKTQLLNKLLGFLRDLEHVVNGAPVDKVLVVRDANGKDPAQLEKTLTDRIQGKVFTFPHAIQFHAVRRSVEAWLLADTAAINEVAAARGGRPISDMHEELEEVEDSKGRFVRLLSRAGLPFDPAVCREIAARTRLEVLRYRCPSFRSFEQKVVDC